MTDTQWKGYANYYATFLVVRASALARRNIHFSVIDDRKPTPFPTHWRERNTSGVSFPRNDLVPAIEWVATALLANYGVCWRWTRHGAGSVWHITNDIGNYVQWDMPGYLRQLRERPVDITKLRQNVESEYQARTA